MKKNFNYEQAKAKLLQRRVELQNETINLATFSEEGNDVKDVGDEAYNVSLQKLQRSIGEAELNEIKLIDQAMERIEEGGYGICIDCSGEISEARLEYYPYAVRCIVCQEAYDS